MTEMTLMTNLVPLPFLSLGRLQAHPVSFAVSWHCAHVTCLWQVGCELHGIGFFLTAPPYIPSPSPENKENEPQRKTSWTHKVSLWKTLD